MLSNFVKKYLGGIWVFGLSATMLGAGLPMDETREFRNEHGQRFNASVVSVEGDEVTLRRTGDNMFETPIASLSPGARQFVRDWQRAFLVEEHLEVTVNDGDREENLNEDAFRAGRNVHWGYQLLLENDGEVPIVDLPIRVRIYYYLDRGSEGKELSYQEFHDVVEEVGAGSRSLYRTPTVMLRELRPEEGTLLIGHDSDSVEDEVAGMVLHFEPGDFRPDPIFYPESLAELVE